MGGWTGNGKGAGCGGRRLFDRMSVIQGFRALKECQGLGFQSFERVSRFRVLIAFDAMPMLVRLELSAPGNERREGAKKRVGHCLSRHSRQQEWLVRGCGACLQHCLSRHSRQQEWLVRGCGAGAGGRDAAGSMSGWDEGIGVGLGGMAVGK
eukprot:366189-Chlamydomonas_euryale.AAC.6